VEAIRTAEEERETLSANRTNPMDEELIKTKGLLRAPSARREGTQRKRETKEGNGESIEKDLTPSPSKDLTLNACQGEMETGAIGDVTGEDASTKEATESSCEDCASTKTQVSSQKEDSNEVSTKLLLKKDDIIEVSTKLPLKNDLNMSKVLDKITHQEKCSGSNIKSKFGSEETIGCTDSSAEAVQALEPATLGSASEPRHTKSNLKVDTISQTQTCSNKINTVSDCEPAVNISTNKLSSKTLPPSKAIPCDTHPVSCQTGSQSPESRTVTSPTLSDSSMCGAGSPGSDTQSAKTVSHEDTSEIEGQDDDMTGGETLRARIERLKVSIDNGTTVPQRSRSPQDSVSQGSRSPQDTVAQGSRSPRIKGSLSNGMPPMVDGGKVVSQKHNDCVASFVGNGEVSDKGDNTSRSVDVAMTMESHELEIKSSTQSRAGSQAGGRRRRRIKSEQINNNPVQSVSDSLGSDINKVTELVYHTE
ncbi:serine-rich adhesin for platelets-like, partial [Pecten maximus]|uniref:serine-rich adhesin for platelets-like n=1 Tax=Pecten maximus TaxID=6579 RepID=UPI001458EFE2